MPYTAPPVKWDHELIVGDSYQPAEVALTDADRNAYDLTGATGEMQIRTAPGGQLLATGTVTVTDAAGGRFSWSITAATTADLQTGTAEYSVRLTFGDGSIRTVLEGRIRIRRAVVA